MQLANTNVAARNSGALTNFILVPFHIIQYAPAPAGILQPQTSVLPKFTFSK